MADEAREIDQAGGKKSDGEHRVHRKTPSIAGPKESVDDSRRELERDSRRESQTLFFFALLPDSSLVYGIRRDSGDRLGGWGRFSDSSLPDLIRQSMLTGSMRSFWVYILASRPRGTLYVGMTGDLIKRIYQHREGLTDGFTKEHGVTMLVYFEQHATAIAAIQREKNIKHWSRKWKIDLVLSMNPGWRDLWDDIVR